MILETIHEPADLKSLDQDQLKILCGEIRRELIHTVSLNGGHLASNLGIVELTIALHRVFDFLQDRIVFDVGHQCYVHKMITGRYERFSTLRQYNGLSGFPRRIESPFDCFETGHASTAISAALGMARARDYRNENFGCIALVGDGALTGGMCYEALNDAGNSKTKMIVVLNDNEMSIAKNVGALSTSMTNIRVSSEWQNAKLAVRHFRRIPVIGKPVYRLMHAMKTMFKTALVRADSIGFFETMGFEYFGPIDGHNLKELEKVFRKAREFNGPCVIHVKTKKGYGYDKAEERPEIFHGTPPFLVESGDRTNKPDAPSWGHVMATTLADMAEEDPRIVAITAAMPMGTGLDHFAERFPDRLMDVGIAEEHAVTMAAGLAAGGMRPYFAVYSTFFQRCYDQMLHDVAMQELPVVFLLDRSGVGGEDGKTHHGVFDLSLLLPVPGMTVLSPGNVEELQSMLRWTISQNGPVAIRYARSGGIDFSGMEFSVGKWQEISKGNDLTLLATGLMVGRAEMVRKKLLEKGISAAVVNCSSLKPLDNEFLKKLDGKVFFTLEEHMKVGGFGAYVYEKCGEMNISLPRKIFAVEDGFITHGKHELLLKDVGLDEDTLCLRIQESLERSSV